MDTRQTYSPRPSGGFCLFLFVFLHKKCTHGFVTFWWVIRLWGQWICRIVSGDCCRSCKRYWRRWWSDFLYASHIRMVGWMSFGHTLLHIHCNSRIRHLRAGRGDWAVDDFCTGASENCGPAVSLFPLPLPMTRHSSFSISLLAHASGVRFGRMADATKPSIYPHLSEFLVCPLQRL